MKKLPIGLSDFKQVMEDDYYYVDKSLLIKEIVDQGAVALLLPRPRRFGKTLNLSMLRYFFEKTESDTSALFRHLKIWQAGEEYTKRQGKYPVIYLTFKDVKEANWESALRKIKRLLQAEIARHGEVRSMLGGEKERRDYYDGLMSLKAEQADYEDGLKQLTHDLARLHHERVVVLIDEYDTPIQAGYLNGYYAEVVGFMRNFLSAGLKDNPHLSKGVLTGIMRIAKESIFSGLNNLEVYSLLSHDFADKFGLTEAEVKQMLRDFHFEEDEESVNQWYNGYRFGSVVIYNPWSIISYLNKRADGFKPYWLNTSDNSLIEQLLTRGGVELKDELECLIRRESVEKPIEENIVFAEIEQQDDALWSFLLFSGYLKYVGKRQLNDRWFYQLQIPNREVSSIYARLVERWFKTRFDNKKQQALLQALIKGEIKNFERRFRELVASIFSYHDFGDEAEKVYQAFVIGLLVWLGGEYEIKSERESGYGRCDLMIIPRDLSRWGYVIEFKKVLADEEEDAERATEKALAQIIERNYAAELESRGVKNIKLLAVIFHGKQVWVKERTAV
jgi:hypothetical protein